MSVLRAIFKIVLWLVCLGFLCLAAVEIFLSGGALPSSIDDRDTSTLVHLRPLIVLHLADNGNNAKGICPKILGAEDAGIVNNQKTIQKIINDIFKNIRDGSPTKFGCVEGVVDPSNWAIWLRLRDQDNKAFCIDSKSLFPTLDLPTGRSLTLLDATCPTNKLLPRIRKGAADLLHSFYM